MDTKKQTTSIIIGLFAGLIMLGSIFWFATKDLRLRNSTINDIDQAISEYRSGKKEYIMLIYLKKFNDDPKFQDFINSKAEEMIANKEVDLLSDFLSELEDNDYYSDSIVKLVNNYFNSCSSLEELLYFAKKVGAYDIEYYNKELPSINKNTKFVADYINTNGTKTISKNAGTGYYANYENESYYKVIGIEGSPLYDAKTVTYFGDFKQVRKYGVALNEYYEEEAYSSTEWFFKDINTGFNPLNGSCIWSGDYLFSFSSTGDLLHCYNLTTNRYTVVQQNTETTMATPTTSY